jgi:sugar lactone lactonase YvrE
LYVSEAFNKGGVPISNKILRFTVKPDGTLGDKTVFRDFAKYGTAYSDVDGMRTDTSGNLYVTRYADGKIVLLSPAGSILKSFQLPFAHITNLELGGKDGKTLVAVGGCGPGPVSKTKQPATKGCAQVVGAQATPGRAWQMLQDGLPAKLG